MNRPATAPTPVCWTIAGSDSSGGAGIQADLRTMHAFGVHGCSVVTAVTAQDAERVHAIEPLSGSVIAAQFDALLSGLRPAAVKVGMLGSCEAVEQIAARLGDLHAWVVCDPVLRSSGGTDLIDRDALEAFRKHLLPRVDLLTPNLPEAERLLGRAITSPGEVEGAAADLLMQGPGSVLIKGGHAEDEDGLCRDFWCDGEHRAWLTSPRLQAVQAHGTGCTVSSALAACLARGYAIADALVLARAYVNQGLRTGSHGLLGFGGFPSAAVDLPWLAPTANKGRPEAAFPPMGLPIGLYPIVDRADWVERLFVVGVPYVQIRAKDLGGAALEQEIRTAIACARRFPESRLIVNDHWQLAIELGAYGVHLGQDDLPDADLAAIRTAGLRLGVSTHSYVEMARAKACRPSYIAIGTVNPTQTKKMDYPALGLDAFRRMARLCDVPVVAIGGIHLESAEELLDAGAAGLAVISEIRDAPDLEHRLANWKALLAAR